MLVKMRTSGAWGIGNYNTSVPIEFDCALCGLELETNDGFVTHPTEVDDGIFKVKIRKLDCAQAGMKAIAAIHLKDV